MPNPPEGFQDIIYDEKLKSFVAWKVDELAKLGRWAAPEYLVSLDGKDVKPIAEILQEKGYEGRKSLPHVEARKTTVEEAARAGWEPTRSIQLPADPKGPDPRVGNLAAPPPNIDHWRPSAQDQGNLGFLKESR